jgi:hypothetical protein
MKYRDGDLVLLVFGPDEIGVRHLELGRVVDQRVGDGGTAPWKHECKIYILWRPFRRPKRLPTWRDDGWSRP